MIARLRTDRTVRPAGPMHCHGFGASFDWNTPGQPGFLWHLPPQLSPSFFFLFDSLAVRGGICSLPRFCLLVHMFAESPSLRRLGSEHKLPSKKSVSASEIPSSTLLQPSWPQAAAPLLPSSFLPLQQPLVRTQRTPDPVVTTAETHFSKESCRTLRGLEARWRDTHSVRATCPTCATLTLWTLC